MDRRSVTTIRDLPREVLAQVFLHIPPSSIQHSRRACSDFKTIISDITLSKKNRALRAGLFSEDLAQLQDQIKELLNQGSDIFACEKIRNTPDLSTDSLLRVAVRNGCHRTTELIITDNLHIDVNAPDVYGTSLLREAIAATALGEMAQTRMVKLLLRHPKIDVGPSGIFGRTPLMSAASVGSHSLFMEIANHPG